MGTTAPFDRSLDWFRYDSICVIVVAAVVRDSKNMIERRLKIFEKEREDASPIKSVNKLERERRRIDIC